MIFLPWVTGTESSLLAELPRKEKNKNFDGSDEEGFLQTADSLVKPWSAMAHLQSSEQQELPEEQLLHLKLV